MNSVNNLRGREDMDDQFESSQQTRRDFLERAGRFALYTTPTIIMLMHPGTEAIASGPDTNGKAKAKAKAKGKEG
jgi:hypothetical protein